MPGNAAFSRVPQARPDSRAELALPGLLCNAIYERHLCLIFMPFVTVPSFSRINTLAMAGLILPPAYDLEANVSLAEIKAFFAACRSWGRSLGRSAGQFAPGRRDDARQLPVEVFVKGP